jgi:hypothetical protein
MSQPWYRMNDAEPRGVFPVEPGEARRWNERGEGIFASVNEFNGARRIENLIRIRAWPIDMDTGSKAEQRERILASPLVPSRIVETKRGHQVYWFAKDGRKEHWNALVLERLVPWFGADKNARDIARILRVPGYLHLKDPSTPFLVRRCPIRNAPKRIAYTERQLADAFPWVPDPSMQRARHEEQVRAARAETPVSFPQTDDFWERVYNLDCEEGLRRLSGHWAVGGEQFTFRRCSNGNLNILVGGKGTSCFIDGNRRIGSLSGGGPTLATWIRWYGHDWATAAKVLRELYPQLEVK